MVTLAKSSSGLTMGSITQLQSALLDCCWDQQNIRIGTKLRKFFLHQEHFIAIISSVFNFRNEMTLIINYTARMRIENVKRNLDKIHSQFCCCPNQHTPCQVRVWCNHSSHLQFCLKRLHFGFITFPYRQKFLILQDGSRA